MEFANSVPQTVFRGTGLISGVSFSPVTLIASEEEMILNAGLGLSYKFTPQKVISIEIIKDKQFEIRHTSRDCPTDVICCSKSSVSEIISKIYEIGFIPSGSQEDSTPIEGFSIHLERLLPVALFLVVTAYVLDHYVPIMERSIFSETYLSLGVIPLFIFTGLLDMVVPFRQLFLNPDCNTEDFTPILRLTSTVSGILSFASIVVLLGVPVWLASFPTMFLAYLLLVSKGEANTEDDTPDN